jgi:hypothetical protein
VCGRSSTTRPPRSRRCAIASSLGCFDATGPLALADLIARIGAGEYRVSAYGFEPRGLRWEVFVRLAGHFDPDLLHQLPPAAIDQTLAVLELDPWMVGQLHMYLSAVDDMLKQPDDQPTTGLWLCRGKNELVVEYAHRDQRSTRAANTLQTLHENALRWYSKGLPFGSPLETI